MIQTANVRILTVILLLAAQALLFPIYAQQPINPSAGSYPDQDDVSIAPDQYLGQQVEIAGIVKQTSPLLVEVETTNGPREITVTDAKLSPEVGDKVRVLGVLTEPRTIQSDNAFVVPQGGRWYAWSVSFVAGLWVLSRLIQHWTIDTSRLSFHPRTHPIRLRDIVSGGAPREGGDDA